MGEGKGKKPRLRTDGLLKTAARPQRLEWVILFAVLAVLFVSYDYNDILITTRQGINLWDALFSGRILHFYELNQNAASGNRIFDVVQSADYDFPVYVVFALWNLPLWLLERFLSVDVMNAIPCLLWSKALLVVFLAGTAKVFRGICDDLFVQKRLADWSVFLYLSSTLVLTSLFVTSQYDILGILFLLLGFRAYLRDDQKGFLIWFAVALPFKIFAALLLIPLVLLRQKKVLRIVGQLAVVTAPLLLLRLAFFLAAAHEAPLLQDRFLDMLTLNSLPLSVGSVSLFFLGTCLIALYAYATNPKDPADRNRHAVHLAFLAFGAFFVLAVTTPYWSILWVPFTLLLILANPSRFRTALIFETVMAAAFVVVQMFRFPQCFLSNMIQPMLVARLFPGIGDKFQIYVLNAIPASGSIQNGALSLFVACAISLGWMLRPQPAPAADTQEAPVERSLLWARMLIGAGLCMVPILLYVGSVLLYG